MKIINYLYLVVLIAFMSCHDQGKEQTAPLKNNLQVRQYPLLTIDSNISAWSATSKLYNSQLKHPDGSVLPLVGLIRVDGKVYRFMGTEELPDKAIAGMSADSNWQGKYTFVEPDHTWTKRDFDDRDWSVGKAPFGTKNVYPVNTIWPSSKIWVRRKIVINQDDILNKDLYFKYSHDDVFEVYMNDLLLVKTGFEWRQNEVVKIPDKIKETIKDGEIVIAAHCKNLSGGALVDFGVYTRREGDDDEWTGKYTCVQPPEGWQQEHFDDQDWESGKAPFGTPADYRVNTRWNTPDIWVRREINLDPGLLKKTLMLKYSHDDEFELFINGIQIVKTEFEWKQNEVLEIPDKIKKTIKDGRIVLAAHCKNKRGGALVDFTIYGEDIALQKSVDVQPTRTSYVFECGNVELKLDFIAPLLLNDIELMSRPVNYLSYEVVSKDGKEHQVEVYFELTPAWASSGTFRTNTSEVYISGDLMFIKTGRKVQKVFAPEEESTRQNWGYFYMCTDKSNTTGAIGDATELRSEFVSTGCLSKDRTYGDPYYLSLVQALGSTTQASGKIMVGYDDIQAIQYFGENLSPYWNRTGERKIEELFDEANRDYNNLIEKCDAFDHELHQKTASEMGKVYADFLTLNYRQLVTANKIVEGPEGEVLLFSSGQTVAVNHLSSLLLDKNTELLKALLNPIFHYGESSKWEKAYPPSNMGRYPLANGEIKHRTTPEEAAGNMLILTAAITRQEGNADYAKQHWEALTKWNNYLAGHITSAYEEAQMSVSGHRNVSDSDRSPRIIMGLSSYHYMSEMINQK